MHLWITAGRDDKLAGKRILHFAPEKAVMRRMRGDPLYETADLAQPGMTHKVDITDTKLPDASYDITIANHVLEHIADDHKAMRELFRLSKPGGFGVLSVPINPTRQTTYENAAVTSAVGRKAHFSAPDHVRFYGRDFMDRLAKVGFQVEIFREAPEAEIEIGLLRDEWLYNARKPASGHA
jgi:predicted SAM-dependent methyltransferase